MPKLLPKDELTRIQQETLIKATEPLFEYFVIPSQTLQRVSEAVVELIDIYNQRLAKDLLENVRLVIEAQKYVAEFIRNITELLTTFSAQFNFVIRVPRQETQSEEVVPIYIQPDGIYAPQKVLPVPKRKRSFSIEKVEIKEKGFILDGQYISGMTTESMPGQIFKLMVRNDSGGVISDKLLSETLRIRNDYGVIGMVMHDLMKILRKNNLKPEIRRNRGIKEYSVTNITKYIRKPKRRRKSINTDKSN